MESKTIVLIVMICVGAAGAVGGLLTFLKPKSAREAEAISAPVGASKFPQRQTSAAATESASKLSNADEWNSNQRTAASSGNNGSLGFVRGGGGLTAGGAGGPGGASAEAAAAAADGDAKGLIAGLQEGAEKGLGKKAIRAVMQKVVDTVHKTQPRWYTEFLSNRELKAIADTYDKTLDFPSFLRQVAQAPAFKSMLKKRSNTPQLRQLTKKLLDDKEAGPKLEELFYAHAKDPDVIGTIRQFGAGAGLPSELLEYTGAAAKKAAKAKTTGGRPKLQLKQGGFGGGFKSKRDSDSGGGGGDEAPEGIDPAQLEQYKKYLKK